MGNEKLKKREEIIKNYYELFYNLTKDEIKVFFSEWINRLPASLKLEFNNQGLEKAKSSEAFQTWCLEKKGWFLEQYLKEIE